MTGEEAGVLPTLRSTEETLGKLTHKHTRIARLLHLQGLYRQDAEGLMKRVYELACEAAEEDESKTDTRRQEMHERSKTVFEGVKKLKERVKEAQVGYQQAGINVSTSEGVGGGVGGGNGQEARLQDIRKQIRKLSERLHKVRYYEEKEGEEDGRGGEGGQEESSDDDDEAHRPPIRSNRE